MQAQATEEAMSRPLREGYQAEALSAQTAKTQSLALSFRQHVRNVASLTWQLGDAGRRLLRRRAAWRQRSMARGRKMAAA